VTPERWHTKVGPYEIVARLGAGRMGVVYKAKDTRLQRFVALKFLPDEVAREPRALARFTREAQLASSLNHPNICTIYEIGEQDGQCFIAMELLEGHTLQTKIAGQPLPLETFLDLALQITDALEAAHERAIVHRDLKPSNIFVSDRGDAKLLDFGLAKHVRPESLAAADAATISGSLTIPGQIVGTIVYMSPEQARGEELDARTDLFSLGVVLYEMATGRRAFDGKSTAVVFEAILSRAPETPLAVNPSLPSRLAEIIEKCLEKDRDLRCQSAAELRGDLKRLKRDLESSRTSAARPAAAVAAATSRPIGAAAWAIRGAIALALVVAGIGATLLYDWANMPPRVIGIQVLTRDGRLKGNEVGPTPLVTDGERIYFTEAAGLTPLLAQVSVSGGDTVSAPAPFADIDPTSISPDGSSLLLGGTNSFGGDMSFYAIQLPQGTPRRLDDFRAQDAAWSRDGQHLAYAEGRELYIATADGNSARKIATVPDNTFWPRWSPDGRTIRFSTGYYTGQTKLWEVSTDGTGRHQLLGDSKAVPEACCGDWSPDGKEYYFEGTSGRQSNIWALAQGGRRPVQLTNGPLSFRSPVVSPDGKKIFVVGEEQRGQTLKYDAKLSQFVPILEGISPEWIDFSRDGKWICYTTLPDGTLWRARADGSDKLQLTFAPMQATLANWSPDASEIAFDGRMPGKPWNIYLIHADGTGLEQLFPEDLMQVAASWEPDGQHLSFSHPPAYANPQPGQALQIETMDLKTRKMTPVPGSRNLWGSGWSPDGRYMVALPADGLSFLMYDARTETWKKFADVAINFGDWRRDSQYFYYDTLGADPAFYRVHVPDLKVERVVNLRGYRRPFGFLGAFSGVAADGSPLIVDDIGLHEIYALDLKQR